jgi:hypothetical protein
MYKGMNIHEDIDKVMYVEMNMDRDVDMDTDMNMVMDKYTACPGLGADVRYIIQSIHN